VLRRPLETTVQYKRAARALDYRSVSLSGALS
jgi:hypothetical protein